MTYLKDIVTLELNTGICTGCGMCKTVCPHGVFTIKDGKAGIVNRDNCMECGACMMNCPVNALTVNKGVGCAYAIISSKLRGRKEISCDCGCSEESSDSDCGC